MEEEIQNEIFTGQFKHEYNIQERFNFLEYFLMHSEAAVHLDQEGINHLWEIFVTNPPSLWESKIFFRWLGKKRRDPPAYGLESRHSPVFLPVEITYIFDNLLAPNTNLVQKIGEDFQDCVLEFFKKQNLEIKSIGIVNKLYITTLNFEKVLGMENLWNLMLESDESLQVLTGKVIVEIYQNLDISIMNRRTSIWGSFLEKCFGYIGEEGGQEKTIQTILRLLKRFLEQFASYPHPEETPPYYYGPATLNITIRPSNKLLSFQISYYNSVSFIKKMAAQKLDIHHSEFSLHSGTREFRIGDDKIIWRDVYSSHLSIELHEGVETLSKELYPAMVISNTPQYINTLFGLLSKDKGIYIYIYIYI